MAADNVSSAAERFSKERLEEILWSWRSAILIIESAKIGIFDAISDESSAPARLSERLGLDERVTRLTLQALAGEGVLIKNGDRYRLSEVGSRYLRSDSDQYIGALLRLTDRSISNWRALEGPARSGRPIRKPAKSIEEEKSWRAVFLGAMKILSLPKSALALDNLPVKEGDAIIDVGAGPATYLIELARRFSNLDLVAFDLPDSADVVMAEALALEPDRRKMLRFEPGDAMTSDFGSDRYDGAIVSQVLHIFGQSASSDIVRRLARAIKPGGFLAIQEMTLKSDADLGQAALFGVQMAIGTENGSVYDQATMRAFFVDAGLSIEKVVATDDRSELYIGRRPVSAR